MVLRPFHTFLEFFFPKWMDSPPERSTSLGDPDGDTQGRGGLESAQESKNRRSISAGATFASTSAGWIRSSKWVVVM